MEKSEAIQAVIEAGQTIRNHILLAEDDNSDKLKACMLQEIRAAAFQFKAAADYAVNNNDDNIGKKIISTEEGIKTLIDKSKQMNIDYRVNVFACYNNIRFVKKYVDSSGSSADDTVGLKRWLETVTDARKTSESEIAAFIDSLQTVKLRDVMRWYRLHIGADRATAKEYFFKIQTAANRYDKGWNYDNAKKCK